MMGNYMGLMGGGGLGGFDPQMLQRLSQMAGPMGGMNPAQNSGVAGPLQGGMMQGGGMPQMQAANPFGGGGMLRGMMGQQNGGFQAPQAPQMNNLGMQDPRNRRAKEQM